MKRNIQGCMLNLKVRKWRFYNFNIEAIQKVEEELLDKEAELRDQSRIKHHNQRIK